MSLHDCFATSRTLRLIWLNEILQSVIRVLFGIVIEIRNFLLNYSSRSSDLRESFLRDLVGCARKETWSEGECAKACGFVSNGNLTASKYLMKADFNCCVSVNNHFVYFCRLRWLSVFKNISERAVRR